MGRRAKFGQKMGRILSVRLNPEEMDRIDQLRGTESRSDYVRHVLAHLWDLK